MSTRANPSGSQPANQAGGPIVLIVTPDVETAARAASSATRFGLPVILGLTASAGSHKPGAGVTSVEIGWNNDFSVARNALAEAARQYAADEQNMTYALWLDSDEELAEWPSASWPPMHADWFNLPLQDRADLTPRAATRLQRLDASLTWRGAIHERLVRTQAANTIVAEPQMLSGALIIHHGYEDDAIVEAKIQRNAFMAQQSEAQTLDPTSALITSLTDARASTGTGDEEAKAWRRVFDHPAAQPAEAESIDRRVEAALSLCAAGDTGPAGQVLERNPRILSLQLAVLQADYLQTGKVDGTRLAFVQKCLDTNDADPRYSYSRALLGADAARLKAIAMADTDAPDDNVTDSDMDTRYRRSEHIDMETLGDELILMNADSREVVTLNSTAQALWECLEDEISGTEIMAIFSELYPDVAAAALEQDISATLTRLRTAGLIEASETNA